MVWLSGCEWKAVVAARVAAARAALQVTAACVVVSAARTAVRDVAEAERAASASLARSAAAVLLATAFRKYIQTSPQNQVWLETVFSPYCSERRRLATASAHDDCTPFYHIAPHDGV